MPTLPKPTLPKPTKRLTAAQAAAIHIRRMIFDGRLRAGETIPPGRVAADLGISRIPVREALVALEQQGLVTIIPHRGAFVTVVDGRDVIDHFELFGLVHGLAAQRTAERATCEQIDRLGRAQAALACAEDPADVLARMIEFNEIILDVGGSPRTRAIAGMMSGMLPGNMFELIPTTITEAKQGTAEIVRAICRADGDAAFAACRTMMRSYGEMAEVFLAERGVLDR